MAPKLSVCIQTYNRASLIERALKSVQEIQDTGIEVEAVISDDASTDDTGLVVSHLSKNYPFIRYYKNSRNYDVYDNVGLAVRRARGDYIVLLCDDDTLISSEFPSIISMLDHRPDIAMIASNFHLKYDRSGKEVCIPSNIETEDNPNDLSLIEKGSFAKLLDLFLGGTYFPEVVLLRRSVIDSMVGGLSDTGYILHHFAAQSLKWGHIWNRQRPFYCNHNPVVHSLIVCSDVGARLWSGEFENRFRNGLEYILSILHNESNLSPEDKTKYADKINNHIYGSILNAACVLFELNDFNKSLSMLQRAFLMRTNDVNFDFIRGLAKCLIPVLCANRIFYYATEALNAKHYALYNDRRASCKNKFGKLPPLGLHSLYMWR